MNYLQAFSEAIPVILLIGIGNLLRRINFSSKQGVEELKKLVVNISLPALLFISFLDINFKREYLFVVLVVFLFNLILLGIGKILAWILQVKGRYFPLLFTGFEAGMLGIPLFGAVYGLEKVKYIGMIDVGHEIFIWFVLVAILLQLKNEENNLERLSKSFFTSPVIIAILLGIAINISGIKELVSSNLVWIGVLDTLQLLAQVTTPLILLVIGYEIEFQKIEFNLSLKIIGGRLVLGGSLAVLVNQFVFSKILNLTPFYQLALLSLCILPPPFIIPLFIRQRTDEDYTYIYNTLSLSAVISVLIFIVLSLLYNYGVIF